jgi:SPX domain protein involved in polyphosphate accumulation
VKRYEYKFLISSAQGSELSSRLAGAFSRDPHGDEYFIRSLYFDDVRMSAYYDKIAGVKDRVKYRIRFYNSDDSYIVFEAKRKSGKMVSKTSFEISHTDADAIIAGHFGVLEDYGAPLAEEFLAASQREKFYPAAVTDYIREAFVHPASNLRITFDKSLSTITDFNIFSEGIKKHIFDNDSIILEVKYDEILPNMARQMIPFIGQSQAVSKYCLCLETAKKLRGNLKNT